MGVGTAMPEVRAVDPDAAVAQRRRQDQGVRPGLGEDRLTAGRHAVNADSAVDRSARHGGKVTGVEREHKGRPLEHPSSPARRPLGSRGRAEWRGVARRREIGPLSPEPIEAATPGGAQVRATDPALKRRPGAPAEAEVPVNLTTRDATHKPSHGGEGYPFPVDPPTKCRHAGPATYGRAATCRRQDGVWSPLTSSRPEPGASTSLAPRALPSPRPAGRS